MKLEKVLYLCSYVGIIILTEDHRSYCGVALCPDLKQELHAKNAFKWGIQLEEPEIEFEYHMRRGVFFVRRMQSRRSKCCLLQKETSCRRAERNEWL